MKLYILTLVVIVHKRINKHCSHNTPVSKELDHSSYKVVSFAQLIFNWKRSDMMMHADIKHNWQSDGTDLSGDQVQHSPAPCQARS